MGLPDNYITNRGGNKRSNNAQIVAAAIPWLTLTNPLATDDDAYLTTTAGPNAATTSPTLVGARVTGGIGRPDYPRNVFITVTHATSVVAMSGVIIGVGMDERPLTEAWSVTATGTSKVFTGKKAFKRVTAVTLVAAGDASANSVIVGMGKVFGFGFPVAVASAIKEIASGSLVTNGTVVAASTASTDDPYGTYSPNANPDGSADFEVYVISKYPERS